MYFSNVIGSQGVHPDLKKVKVIQDMQYPADKQEMKSFFGMVNFLTRFEPHLSEKTADLLKRNAVFDMTPHYKNILNKVMKAMESSKTLTLYDPKEDVM